MIATDNVHTFNTALAVSYDLHSGFISMLLLFHVVRLQQMSALDKLFHVLLDLG